MTAKRAVTLIIRQVSIDATKAQTTSFKNLPADLIIEIAQYLPVKDKVCLAVASKCFYQILRRSVPGESWKFRDFEDVNNRLEYVHQLEPFFPRSFHFCFSRWKYRPTMCHWCDSYASQIVRAENGSTFGRHESPLQRLENHAFSSSTRCTDDLRPQKINAMVQHLRNRRGYEAEEIILTIHRHCW